MASQKQTICPACHQPMAYVADGRKDQLCTPCESAWATSPERARTQTARADFARRRWTELSQERAAKRAAEEDLA